MSATLLFLALLPAPLTDRLSARDWRTRERATSALRALGPLAVPALERGLSSPDPETRGRCAVLLRPYARQIAEREAARLPCPPFWARYWLFAEDPVLSRFWDAASVEVDCDLPQLDAAHRPARLRATRLWTVSQLLQRRPRAEILAELEQMARAAKAESR